MPPKGVPHIQSLKKGVSKVPMVPYLLEGNYKEGASVRPLLPPDTFPYFHNIESLV